MMLNSCRSVCA